MLLPLAYVGDDFCGSPLLFNRWSNFTHVGNVAWWKDGGIVFPFFGWGRRSGDTFYWRAALGLAGGERTQIGNDAWGHRRLFPLWWQGSTPHGKQREAAKQDRWMHLPPLWWSWKIGGDEQQRNRLLFPLWFSRTYEGSDTKAWFTPLAGAGEDPERKAGWWFALTAGKSANATTTLRWALPLWFSAKDQNTTTHWTPLSYTETSKDVSELHLGPLGYPLPFYRYRSLSRERDLLFPLGYRNTVWHTSTQRSGTPNGLPLNRKATPS